MVLVTRYSCSACIVSAALAACLGLAASVDDRSGAFIGYSETDSYGHCQDKLPNCEKDASLNKCLTDPFTMRRFCPVSCAVEPCVNTGSVLVSICSHRRLSLFARGLVTDGTAGIMLQPGRQVLSYILGNSRF